MYVQLIHIVVQQKLTQHYKAAAAAAKSLQSCPTLCDPIDGSPPGSPVLGILQARTLGWVACQCGVCTVVVIITSFSAGKG